MISTPSATDALWLDTLQRICGRVAHELRGALNGVAVNLEVVRSRSTKSDARASSVSTFAEAAANQLEPVMSMTEALLALGNISTPEPIQVLEQVLRSGPDAARNEAAAACLLAADRQRLRGDLDQAAVLYDLIRKAKVSMSCRVGATRQDMETLAFRIKS